MSSINYSSALEEAKITRVVDEEPKNLADFGLEDATFKMVLRFKTGEPKTLLMGDPSPIDNHEYYFKLADEKRVLLTLLSKNHVNLPLSELRNKVLLNFVPRDVTAVDLKFDKDTQRFVKEGGIWKLTAPVNAQGDADEISNFLNSIRSERIKTFVSETRRTSLLSGLKNLTLSLISMRKRPSSHGPSRSARRTTNIPITRNAANPITSLPFQKAWSKRFPKIPSASWKNPSSLLKKMR